MNSLCHNLSEQTESKCISHNYCYIFTWLNIIVHQQIKMQCWSYEFSVKQSLVFSVHVAKICETFGDLFAFHQRCLWVDGISSWSSHLTPVTAVSHACCSTGPKFLRSCQDLRGTVGPSAAWSVTSSQDDGKMGTGQADGGEKTEQSHKSASVYCLIRACAWMASVTSSRTSCFWMMERWKKRANGGPISFGHWHKQLWTLRTLAAITRGASSALDPCNFFGLVTGQKQ